MTTLYAGDYYEKNVTTGETTSYYTFNGQRIATRSNAGVLWLHGDMLGSASLLTDSGGSTVGQVRYKPFGERRSEWNAYFTDRKFIPQFAALARDVPPATRAKTRSAASTLRRRVSTTPSLAVFSRRIPSTVAVWPTRRA